MTPTSLAPATSKNAVHSSLTGIHILSNFSTPDSRLLITCLSFREFIDQQIEKLSLWKVGEAYHNFEGGGFTGVVCLAESHLSIHTWPDRNYITFDVFLSNHLQNNQPKAEAIYSEVLNFFDGEVVFENHIQR